MSTALAKACSARRGHAIEQRGERLRRGGLGRQERLDRKFRQGDIGPVPNTVVVLRKDNNPTSVLIRSGTVMPAGWA